MRFRLETPTNIDEYAVPRAAPYLQRRYAFVPKTGFYSALG